MSARTLGEETMTTLYIRTFDLKDSLSDAEVLEHWRVLTGEVMPACQ